VDKLKLQHGDKCDTWAGKGGQWLATLKKGACIFVPKSFELSSTVTGQILAGWGAGWHGTPGDIVTRTDRGTLWVLVCTAEALNMPGIIDPRQRHGEHGQYVQGLARCVCGVQNDIQLGT
jgi:fatty acid synthase subunit alpha